MRFCLVVLLLLVVLSKKHYGDGTPLPKDADLTKDYIVHGDFEGIKSLPARSYPPWFERNNLWLGIVTGYSIPRNHNSRWTSPYILNLDTLNTQNQKVYQEINLKKGTYYLQFDHASFEFIAQESNKFEVLWNNQLLQSFVPTDYNIHNAVFTVQGNDGINTVEFRGLGTVDGYGQGIDNVHLYKKIDSTPFPIPTPTPNQNQNHTYDLHVNQDFLIHMKYKFTAFYINKP